MLSRFTCLTKGLSQRSSAANVAASNPLNNSWYGRLTQGQHMEIWPYGVVSKPAMLNGTWKRGLSTLGPAMQRQNWSGVVLDLEELKDNRMCRVSRCHCANCHCPVCIPEVSVDDYIRFLAEFAPALRKYGLRLQVCVGEIGPASISQTDEMLRYMDAMAPDGKLAVMGPVYFGGQTAKSKRWLRPLLNRSTQLNPMFGIEYRQPPGFNLSWCETQHHGPGPIGRRVPPPCNRYKYNRTEFAGLLDWLRENGACEVSLYGLQMENATEFIEDCKACAHCRRFECVPARTAASCEQGWWRSYSAFAKAAASLRRAPRHPQMMPPPAAGARSLTDHRGCSRTTVILSSRRLRRRTAFC